MTTKQPDNMRIWNVLGKTDPAHTKQFTRAGGFKGTAVKPMWANKQMTELFGPAGIGWGSDEPKYQLVESAGEILVFCTVRMWYAEGGAVDDMSRTGQVFGVGGDKVVSQVFLKDGRGQKIVDEAKGGYKTYPQTDDEAFKKAYTDAISNAMKFIGVAADVHMGLFDDNKYVQDVRNEFEEEKKKEVFAEVERQKSLSPSSNVGLVGTPANLPPELDWNYNKSSGVLICKPASVKKAKNKKGTEFVVVTLNGYIGERNEAFYFHKSHTDALMGAAGKVCKFMLIESKGFVNIDAVLEIDGDKVPDGGDAEFQSRLIASNLGLDAEELREVFSVPGKGSWTVTLEKLKEREAEVAAGVEAGNR